MKKNSDNIKEKAIDLLNNSKITGYQIEKDTGITEASISNYRNGKTRPTIVNAEILIKYLSNQHNHNSDYPNQANKLDKYKDTTLLDEDEHDFIINNLNPKEMINRVITVLENKDKQFNALINQQNKLIEQQDKLLSQQNKLIDVIASLSSNIEGREKKESIA